MNTLKTRKLFNRLDIPEIEVRTGVRARGKAALTLGVSPVVLTMMARTTFTLSSKIRKHNQALEP